MQLLSFCIQESFACKAWSPKASKMAQPDLNYIAPEIQTTEVCTYVSDMFSFGMLICTIYNNGYSLIDAQYNPSTYLRQLDTVRGYLTSLLVLYNIQQLLLPDYLTNLYDLQEWVSSQIYTSSYDLIRLLPVLVYPFLLSAIGNTSNLP